MEEEMDIEYTDGLTKVLGVVEGLTNIKYGANNEKLRYVFKIVGEDKEFGGFYDDMDDNPGFKNGDKICFKYQESNNGGKIYYNLKYLISNLSEIVEDSDEKKKYQEIDFKSNDALMLAAVNLCVARGGSFLGDKQVKECYDVLKEKARE